MNFFSRVWTKVQQKSNCMPKIWPKMYHLGSKKVKIDPGVSKIEPKWDILKETTRNHGKFIL